MRAAHSKFPLELHIRYLVYQRFVETTKPTTVAEAAAAFGISLAIAQRVFLLLHDQHFFFLEPGTTAIRMANPLSAVPTNFRVYTGTKSYGANYVWDRLSTDYAGRTIGDVKKIFDSVGLTGSFWSLSG